MRPKQSSAPCRAHGKKSVQLQRVIITHWGSPSITTTSRPSVSLAHPRAGRESAAEGLVDGGSSSTGHEPHARALPWQRVAGTLPARQLRAE